MSTKKEGRKQKEQTIAKMAGKEHDLYQKTFTADDKSMLDMMSFLQEMEDNQKWLQLALSQMDVVVESGGRLILDSLKSKYDFYEGVNDEAIVSTIENGKDITTIAGSQFFVETTELGTKKTVIPVSTTGLSSLVLRSGTDCSAIARASLLDKQTIINIGLKTLQGKTTKCLVSCGKVRAFNGGTTYAILKESEMFNGILKYLYSDECGKFTFKGGVYTHDRTTAAFELVGDTEKIMKSYMEACKKIGSKSANDFKVWLNFSTSEVGAECATISVSLVRGLMRIMLGSPIKVEHTGDNTAQTFVDQLPTMMAKTKDLMKALENLINIEIKYPVNAIIALGKSVGLSKTATLTVATDMQNQMDADKKTADEKNMPLPKYSAHDVFFYCQEALMIMRKNEVSPATVEKCEENLSRCLAGNGEIWSEVDKELRPEWTSGN